MSPIIEGIVLALTVLLTWHVTWYALETVSDFLYVMRMKKYLREQHRINHERYLRCEKAVEEIAKHNGWEDKE